MSLGNAVSLHVLAGPSHVIGEGKGHAHDPKKTANTFAKQRKSRR
jgi:hypothetical protein